VDILVQDFSRTQFIDEPQIQQFSDPKHPGMVAWKVDYVLPEDAGNPKIELDYDYSDQKVEGDAFSTKHLNSAKVEAKRTTLSFVILLGTKESSIVLDGKEFRGKGTPLITDKKAKLPSRPSLDSGTGGFMLAFKPNPNGPPNQVSSYFDLDSWVLLGFRFNSASLKLAGATSMRYTARFS
jgi:hypothetical protein